MTTVDVYPDLMCPWCFTGKRRLYRHVADDEARLRAALTRGANAGR